MSTDTNTPRTDWKHTTPAEIWESALAAYKAKPTDRLWNEAAAEVIATTTVPMFIKIAKLETELQAAQAEVASEQRLRRTMETRHGEVLAELTALRAEVVRLNEHAAAMAKVADNATEHRKVVEAEVAELREDKARLTQWVPVAKGMPPDRQRVLVAHLNGIHVWRAIAAYWPAGTMDATNWDDPPDDWWDESGNRCVCPDAGWWEECSEIEGASMLRNVTHWMPLPAKPDQARKEGA